MKNREQRGNKSRKQYNSAQIVQKGAPAFDLKVLAGGNIVSEPSEVNLIVENALKNPQTLYNIAERTQALNVGIDLIASQVASATLLFKSKKNDDKITDDRSESFNHPLTYPNPDQDQFSFLYKSTVIALIEGGVYWFFGELNRVPLTIAIKPSEMTVKRDSKGFVTGYQWKQMNLDKDMVRAVGKPGYVGVDTFRSPVRAVIDNTFLNAEAAKMLIENFRNGLVSKGLLMNKSGDGLSSAASKQSLADFMGKQNGQKGVKVLSPGWEFVSIAASVVESSVIETSKLSNIEIIRGLGLPESLYNNEATNYATADVQNTQFVKKTILPLCSMLERALNSSPIVKKDRKFEFDLGSMESAEQRKFEAEVTKLRADAAAVQQSLGLVSDNEIRKTAGFDSIKDVNGNPSPEADINPTLKIKVEPSAVITPDSTIEDVTDEPT